MFKLFGNKFEKEKEELRKWLAHPNEFGEVPSEISHIKEYHVSLMNYGKTKIQLFRYQMPNGFSGRGFVNPVTWSFLGDDVEKIPDDLLLFAYAGWLFLFPAIQEGKVLTDFESDGERERYLEQLKNHGLTDIQVVAQYKIGTSELYEFKAFFNGEEVRGAGNTESEIGCNASDPKFFLPAIYFLLGNQVLPR
ncbi:hypothetical protein [Cerasicoccus fimbriatus]|uniref:hypothetical protein n=1 Tax=Cerasicoccus fimbriatus TaxID=3014554 RepID=UPI0022B34B9E|nr:hypothetical protein [Cerasicoccus sp. TK19100]